MCLRQLGDTVEEAYLRLGLLNYLFSPQTLGLLFYTHLSHFMSLYLDFTDRLDVVSIATVLRARQPLNCG
jgi:hypothetical protein